MCLLINNNKLLKLVEIILCIRMSDETGAGQRRQNECEKSGD